MESLKFLCSRGRGADTQSDVSGTRDTTNDKLDFSRTFQLPETELSALLSVYVPTKTNGHM